jgi:hypothetical protein
MCKDGGAKVGVRRGLHGGVAAFYVGLLLDVISNIGAVPNTG